MWGIGAVRAMYPFDLGGPFGNPEQPLPVNSNPSFFGNQGYREPQLMKTNKLSCSFGSSRSLTPGGSTTENDWGYNFGEPLFSLVPRRRRTTRSGAAFRRRRRSIARGCKCTRNCKCRHGGCKCTRNCKCRQGGCNCCQGICKCQLNIIKKPKKTKGKSKRSKRTKRKSKRSKGKSKRSKRKH